MKFYNITYHSFRQSLYLLSFACFAVGSQAQNASNSPYSRFGIGDLQTIQTPRHLGMGGLSVGLAGVSDFSSKNPASYLNLDSLQVAFEVSLQGTYSRLHEQQPNSEMTSANTNSVSLGQISFAFPITPWLKSSFGLTPKSNMNYNVIREISGDPNLGRQILNHSGQGGLSQVFLGIAGGTSSIAVGVNANYQFGSFVRSAGLLFVDTVLQAPRGTYQDKEVEAAGFAFDLGLQYKQPLLRNYQLGVGFTYSPKYNLNGSRSLLAYAGYGDQGRTLRDTISATGAVEGTLRMPDKYTIGLSFERLNRWVFGAEYAVVNFKNYQEFFQGDTNLSNAYTFRTGLELKGRRMDNDFFNRLTYRFGYHYGTSYLIFGGSEISQYGFSLGMGMPIRRSRSRVDFAIEIGRRGNVNAGQIQENYGRVVIGISAFDQWFIRGKFD